MLGGPAWQPSLGWILPCVSAALHRAAV